MCIPTTGRLAVLILLSYRETIDAKYEGKLQKKYDLPTYRVVSEVFRGLSGRKMIAPGSFARYEVIVFLRLSRPC